MARLATALMTSELMTDHRGTNCINSTPHDTHYITRLGHTSWEAAGESWGTDATTESALSVALLWYFAWSLWSLLTDSKQL